MKRWLTCGLCCLAGLILWVSCDSPDSSLSTAIRTVGPALGKADGMDQADQDCRIVLRSIGRQPGTNGYQTRCSDSGCNWLWQGSLEISEDTDVAGVHVLYRLVGESDWWQVEATPGASPQPGFQRYEFSISDHLFGPEIAEEELAATQIELVPMFTSPAGARVYDHNRFAGPFENTTLTEENSFASSDGGVCQPEFGRISFLDSWQDYLSGPLRQGAYLLVDYDLNRLPDCRGTHNGYPAWEMVAHARFTPGGELRSGSVVAFENVMGQPTNTARTEALKIKIPLDATAVELWFENRSGAGSDCQVWDSRYGENYRYEIWPAVTDPRCKDIERWTTIHSDMPYATSPYCLDYTVEQQHSADSCEFYLSGLGDGYMGHYGIPNNWLEAYLTVGPQQGKLLGAGMLTIYQDPRTNEVKQRLTLGRQADAATWQTGFIYEKVGYMGSGSYHYQVLQVAFFIDVQRPTGEAVRLWQSQRGANFSWDEAFSLPVSMHYIPYGKIKYAHGDSVIFDARRTCE